MALQVPIASKLVVLVKLPRLSGIHSDIEIGENYTGNYRLLDLSVPN